MEGVNAIPKFALRPSGKPITKLIDYEDGLMPVVDPRCFLVLPNYL